MRNITSLNPTQKPKFTLWPQLVVSALVSASDRAVLVRALAGDIILFSWARNFTLKVPLSTQVYK